MERTTDSNIRAQRLLIWLTLILASLFGFGWIALMGFFPPPSPALSADQVLHLYSEHNIRFRIGVILSLVSGGFLMPLTLVISLQMARVERGIPIWAYLQAMTGAVGTIFLFLPVLIWGVAAFSVERAPELTLLMHEFAWLFFITPLSLFELQLLGIIVVCFTKQEDDRYSAFPRWLGYFNIWFAVQSLGGPIALLFKSGIFSWAGLMPFWLPFFLFCFWMGFLAFTILRSLRQQELALAATA
jgi:hypothetical protein